ncbi:MAG: N,N-dimethylformamidase beta subunit family domain-containing protein, partial [Gaiellaceae bacterium]
MIRLALTLLLAGRGPALHGLRVESSRPFAGDRRLLATVSPNGDGVRDRAVVRFRLDRAATVRLDVIRTDTIRPGRPQRTVFSLQRRLRAGARSLTWRPASNIEPRTYLLQLTVGGRVYTNVPGKPPQAPVVRVLGVEAGFPQRSYAPGDRADLRIATDARRLRLQVFHYTSQLGPSERDFKVAGTAMTAPVQVDWSGHRHRPALLRFIRAGAWPSGLYFLRLSAQDGRLGYAPFIVRPRAARTRIGLVLSTNTWQAYNFWDADGDGWGDSWYVSGRTRSVDLTRPYLDFGVPFRFRDWDLDFIAWLNRTG